MFNSLISQLLGKNNNDQRYQFSADDGELTFSTSDKITAQLNELKAPSWIQHQYVFLNMLVEQGLAEPIPNGFIIEDEHAVRLDEEARALLQLPSVWKGKVNARVKGEVRKSNFRVSLQCTDDRGQYSSAYILKGPLLFFSERQQYLLNSVQLKVFTSLAIHKKSKKEEFDNLQLINQLQECNLAGVEIDLSHFNQIEIVSPEQVSVIGEQDAQGNLHLIPQLGQTSSTDEMRTRLGQIQDGNHSALRVKDQIILLDEKMLKATQEIIKNRVIPQSQVAQFLKTPQAYIDASLVDLDTGFSIRVNGASTFKHAYFGEKDQNQIDWFGQLSELSLPPTTDISPLIKDAEQLTEFETTYTNAVKAGADILDFNAREVDIRDKAAINEQIAHKREELTQATYGNDEADNEPESDNETYVVDIELNDEELDIASPKLEEQIQQVLYKEPLDWSNHKRTPFEHQRSGVQWILGLTQKSIADNKVTGALLADDMGLGKTFVSLSAVSHYFQLNSVSGTDSKPVLIVAPLSLLENWKDEVEITFNQSPFTDIVILQSNADLNKFKISGASAETKNQNSHGEGHLDESDIRYSLKVGKNFQSERLDQPKRLVITTYQTLRDYQFSLCRVDWSFVIFDEAQNIKSPNTLQTRAAKGLKAEFKLLATGTPVENSLADFWCLLDTAMPGYLGNYQDFRNKYVTPITAAASDEVDMIRAEVGRKLRLDVGALMLRRLKEDNLADLPAKNIFVGLDDDPVWQYQQQLGSVMVNDQLNHYEQVIVNSHNGGANAALACLQQLRDVSLHPQLFVKDQIDVPQKANAINQFLSESSKLNSVILTLNEIQHRNEKVIIFAVNKRLQAFLSIALARLYKLEKVSVINGDAKAISKRANVPTRKSMIKEFEAKSGFNIIIMSPVAAGVGLTVVGANNVIHLERHWNPAKEAQATDRVYRIGQTKDVNIYVPIAHHPQFESFDVNLHKLLSAKTLLKDAVVTPEEIKPIPGGVNGLNHDSVIIKDSLTSLNWQQFEALVALTLAKKTNATNTILTEAITDQGADVVLTTPTGEHLIQIKHINKAFYNAQRALEDLLEAQDYYLKDASNKQLIFVTNATNVTVTSRKFADNNGIQVVDGNDLMNEITLYPTRYCEIVELLEKIRVA
ncbi:SNF2-related protein [Shewanella sp.]|uniref:SNF2-related protein n=1 Tax=Shewanella sp. TaxID=50422 RepID=UPI001EC6F5C6|nr:SNF2-related protein [Shewanella sp.]NRB24584.1 restriction endonuclease [Shewanella sp.]